MSGVSRSVGGKPPPLAERSGQNAPFGLNFDPRQPLRRFSVRSSPNTRFLDVAIIGLLGEWADHESDPEGTF